MKYKSLQKAKTTYLEQVPNEAMASPYYCAAFVQLGEIKPLNINQKSVLSWYHPVELLLVLLIILLFYNKK